MERLSFQVLSVGLYQFMHRTSINKQNFKIILFPELQHKYRRQKSVHQKEQKRILLDMWFGIKSGVDISFCLLVGF